MNYSRYVSMLMPVICWLTVTLPALAQNNRIAALQERAWPANRSVAYVSHTQRTIDSLQRMTRPGYHSERLMSFRQTTPDKQTRLAAVSCNNHLCGLVNGEVVSTQAGEWNDPAIWSVRRVPLNTDIVRLKHAVTIPTSYSARAGRLRYDATGRLLPKQNGRLRLGS
ncbi:hypothetical protein [Spirosoma flavus]